MKFASHAKLLVTFAAAACMLVAGVAVSPVASATVTDASLGALSVTASSGGQISPSFVSGQSGSYTLSFVSGDTVTLGAMSQFQHNANATVYKVHNSASTPLGTFTGAVPNNINGVTGLVLGDSILIADVGSLNYTITLVAPTYHCNLSANGGQFSDLSSFASVNDGSSLSTPTRTGYVFNGWFNVMLSQTYSGSTCVATSSNPILTAIWVVQPTTCTYSGGYAGAQSGTLSVGQALPALQRSGYSLSGWQSHGGGSVTFSSTTDTTCSTAGNFYQATWTASQSSSAPAKPAPEVKFDSIPTFTPGANGTVNLQGKNLDTYASVTVGGKAGTVSASTDTGVSFKAADGLTPGAYDIVLKTAGGGSLTIQGGYVVSAPVVAPAPAITPAPAIQPIRGVATSNAAVTGFVPGKASALSAAQKSAVSTVVSQNDAKTLECVGLTSAKVSASVARARAAATCAYAKLLNSDLVTSVSTQDASALRTASAAGSLLAPVVLNYTRN